MGQVAGLGFVRLVVNAEDHPPPHVHVISGRGRGEIVVRISLIDLMPLIGEGGRRSERAAKAAQRLVRAYYTGCCDEWNRLHG